MRIVRHDEIHSEPVNHSARVSKQVWLRRGAAPGLTQLASATLAPGESVSGHAHDDMCEVFLVTGGCGTFTVGQAKFELRSGDCLVVEAGETHSVANLHDDSLTLVYLGLAP